MDASALEGLATACRIIMTSGNQVFAWSWDTWPAGMILSKIEKTDRKKAETLLHDTFAGFWDDGKITGAPGKIREIVDSYGGLGKGQIAYASNPDAPAILVALWWPWGNGETVSLRLALTPGAPGCGQDELDGTIRNWFGV
jgi:hypothetical protein